MRYLYLVLLFCSFGLFGQSQGVTNSQTKLRPNQLRWSPTDATNDSVYIIKGDETTGEPAWYLVTLGGGGVADTTLSGDVVGGLNSTFVRKINGVTVENKTPQNREVLTYNGTQWTPDSIDLADLPQMNASRLLGRGSTTSGAPEQLTAGTGLRISTNVLETYMTGGTGITLSGAAPMTVTNSLPDVTVSIAGGGINSVSGTYPNFTVTGTEVDGSTTNEIELPSQTSNSGKFLTTNGTSPSWATVSVIPAGSSGEIQYNNAGSFGALDSFTVSANPDRVGIGVPVPTARLDIQGSGSTSSTNALRVRNSAGTGILTLSNDSQVQVLSNTAASKSSLILSGTGYSGGTATTTKPTLLIEPTGTTSTGWSTFGTKLGVNAESGFTGRLLDLQLNGNSIMSYITNNNTLSVGSSTSTTAVSHNQYSSGRNDFKLYSSGEITDNMGFYTTGGAYGSCYGEFGFLYKNTSTQHASINLDTRNGVAPFRFFVNPSSSSAIDAMDIFRTGSIGIATSNTEKTNAKLEIVSTSKGFLPPRLTAAQRDAVTWVAGDAGMIIYCTDCTATDASTGVSQTWNGSAWKNHY